MKTTNDVETCGSSSGLCKGGRGSLRKRWADKVRFTNDPHSCWEWTGAKQKKGYGQIGEDGKTLNAHRTAWGIAFGPVPAGMQVLHKCDNPSCVRWSHLFLGTPMDNMIDKIEKGRQLRGQQMAQSKLTEADVRQIRQRAAGGEFHGSIAADMNVCRQNVDKIVRRKSWAHVS